MKGSNRYQEKVSAKALLLWPVSVLLYWANSWRRRFYSVLNVLRRRLPVPAIVVVGSATIGGKGKTPLVIWLANQLKANGLRPGIVHVSATENGSAAIQVTSSSLPSEVGAEAIVMARRAQCPVYSHARPRRAARALLKAHGCDVLIAEGALQDYGFPRDLEVAVIDGRQRLGNGLSRPAGPLYEPRRRLEARDFVIVNGRSTGGEPSMGLRAAIAVNVIDPQHAQPLDGFRHQRVHAVTAMLAADRFFDMLRAHGIEVSAHPFLDGHAFTAEELAFEDDQAVLMTEKDAVQCRAFAASNWWFVPVSAVPDSRLGAELIRAVKAVRATNANRSKVGG